MSNSLKDWYDQHHQVAGVFNGQNPVSGQAQNNYSLDGIGSTSAGFAVGAAAWFLLSSYMMHNFGDSGWRKMVSMVAPLLVALPLGIVSTHAVGDLADGKGLTHVFTETASTISNATGIGKPTITRAHPVDDVQSLKPTDTTATAPVPGQPVQPRIAPMQR
jgi:hypothetical protein